MKKGQIGVVFGGTLGIIIVGLLILFILILTLIPSILSEKLSPEQTNLVSTIGDEFAISYLKEYGSLTLEYDSLKDFTLIGNSQTSSKKILRRKKLKEKIENFWNNAKKDFEKQFDDCFYFEWAYSNGYQGNIFTKKFENSKYNDDPSAPSFNSGEVKTIHLISSYGELNVNYKLLNGGCYEKGTD